jgi:hypothetical protein
MLLTPPLSPNKKCLPTAMLTSQEIRNDGAFLTLLQLADFHYTPSTDDTGNSEKPNDMQQLLDREQMIQSVAAKGISAICATGKCII